MLGSDEKFDVILFCYNMHGMKPEANVIERALGMLVEKPEDAMVIVSHRDGALHLDGLVCRQTVSFPTGAIYVPDDDGDVLDHFSSFVAGYAVADAVEGRNIRDKWRKVCRTMGRREETRHTRLLFSSPGIMVTFTKHATALLKLTAQLPVLEGAKAIKNSEARLHHPASIVRSRNVGQLQECARWALKHPVGLAIIGGGHSGHCLMPNVVSVDIGSFDQVYILKGSGCRREFQSQIRRLGSRGSGHHNR